MGDSRSMRQDELGQGVVRIAGGRIEFAALRDRDELAILGCP